MDALVALRTRRSVKRLVGPVPSNDHLKQILEAAVLAPDHKELAPWRFLIIEGEGLKAMGELLATSLQVRDAGATTGMLDKERSKPLRAPMIIAVIAKRLPTRLHFSELVAATAAATQNLLLAAHALGYGAIWRSGAPLQDENVKKAFGFDGDDEIVGFVYIGTPDGSVEERKPKLESVITDWPSKEPRSFSS